MLNAITTNKWGNTYIGWMIKLALVGPYQLTLTVSLINLFRQSHSSSLHVRSIYASLFLSIYILKNRYFTKKYKLFKVQLKKESEPSTNKYPKENNIQRHLTLSYITISFVTKNQINQLNKYSSLINWRLQMTSLRNIGNVCNNIQKKTDVLDRFLVK